MSSKDGSHVCVHLRRQTCLLVWTSGGRGCWEVFTASQLRFMHSLEDGGKGREPGERSSSNTELCLPFAVIWTSPPFVKRLCASFQGAAFENAYVKILGHLSDCCGQHSILTLWTTEQTGNLFSTQGKGTEMILGVTGSESPCIQVTSWHGSWRETEVSPHFWPWVNLWEALP